MKKKNDDNIVPILTVGDNASGKLFYLVLDNIRALYSEKASVDFANNDTFKGINKYNDGLQRTVINRVLSNKLLIHRANNDTSVVDALYCLTPDGDNSSWLNVIKTVIIPFLKYHKVKL